jgi:hypothetical protein
MKTPNTRDGILRLGATVLLCASMLEGCIVINNRGPEPVSPESHEKEISSIRGALSGQRQWLQSFYAIDAECTSLGLPTLRVAKAPRHGRVSIEQSVALADVDKGDARSACNGKSVPATVIFYTSDPGFVGDDHAEFERIGVRGAYAYQVFTIKVRNP